MSGAPVRATVEAAMDQADRAPATFRPARTVAATGS
jgi:hypothetical protein